MNGGDGPAVIVTVPFRGVIYHGDWVIVVDPAGLPPGAWRAALAQVDVSELGAMGGLVEWLEAAGARVGGVLRSVGEGAGDLWDWLQSKRVSSGEGPCVWDPVCGTHFLPAQGPEGSPMFLAVDPPDCEGRELVWSSSVPSWVSPCPVGPPAPARGVLPGGGASGAGGAGGGSGINPGALIVGGLAVLLVLSLLARRSR